MIRKFYSMLAMVLLIVIVAVAVYTLLNLASNTAMKPVSIAFQTAATDQKKSTPIIMPYTTVQKINEYAGCADIEVYYRGPAPEELIGMDYKRLQMKFPDKDGWKVIMQDDEVVISRILDGYCGMHKDYRHLGIYKGQLAIYQGPLGDSSTVLDIERNVDLKLLPLSFQKKLAKVVEFDNLNDDEKLELKKHLEFPDEHYLNSLLENFDELGE